MRSGYEPREYAAPLDDATHTAWLRFRSSQFARDLPWLLFAATWVLGLTVLAIAQAGGGR
jgi:hypothetical protein